MSKLIVIISVVAILLGINVVLFPNNVIAQAGPSYADSSYRERLIDFADIYSYEFDENSKDTILYKRTINSFWYGLFGTANFGLSFGDFKGWIDPNNNQNIYNTVVDFYSQFGQGYTLGLIGEWLPVKSNFGLGLKLGVYDRKYSHVNSDNVEVENYFEGEYDFSANITYFTLAPYAKYTFPFLDGLFLTAGGDFSIAYNTVAFMERYFINTGDIYHKIDVPNTVGDTRFLLSLGVGYDFFIADFFARTHRVRVTPFAEIKGGTNVITSNGSSWNDVTLSVGIQFKLAPDIVTVDTLIYDPASETSIEYLADLRTDEGVEFVGFQPRISVPPSFELAVIPEQTVEVAVNVPDSVAVNVEVPGKTRPATSQTQRPQIRIRENVAIEIWGYTSATSTALTQAMQDTLDQIAKYVQEHPGTIIRLEGHSDNQGTARQNMDRSVARANTAVSYLVGKGVRRYSILDRGRGAAVPISTNDTEAGRRRNRRVSFVIARP